MSKSKSVKQDTSAYSNYLNYLKNYDTGNVDGTLGNLTDYANNASQNLGNTMGNYNFSVDGSEQARQDAQNATYNQYMDRLTPQFERQTSDLATALQNKGLSVGSEAYERAMSDLQQQQNDATSQAAYQSVLAGNNAFSQTLQDEINAGNFGNNAQQSYINQLLSALQGSASGYENQQNIYGVGTAKSAVDYQNKLASAKGGLSGALSGALKGGIAGAMTGNPYGALAGAAAGGYSGYTSNPYAANNDTSDYASLISALAKYKQAGSK